MSKNKNKKLNNAELSSDALDQVAGGQALENHSSEASGITGWKDIMQNKNGSTDWDRLLTNYNDRKI